MLINNITFHGSMRYYLNISHQSHLSDFETKSPIIKVLLIQNHFIFKNEKKKFMAKIYIFTLLNFNFIITSLLTKLQVNTFYHNNKIY